MKPLAANSLLQNRYLIIHHIGKGGMGEVYLAVDQRLGNPVALKRTVFRDDAMMWDAFEREARILARLRHSVLPKVSDHFSEKEEQYLVMEYISGDDLSKRLEAAKKPFPLQWVLYWADELLDALNYLHTHEPPIIHRDIKPQNLKLTNENHVVLLDFGLAKNSVARKTHLSSSSSGSLVGYTPNYAPIEQIRGAGTSPRSDIYSLSATLYQLLTATIPADALTRAESIIGGTGDSLPSPREIVPEVSPEISAVILRGMSLNSEQRYSDAKEMQRALREAYSEHQQRAAQTSSFDGEETVVPEIKAAAPAASPYEAAPGGQAEPHIFSREEVEGMFSKAQEPPPVTLTAEALASETDLDSTISSDQWMQGETQGFTHDEIRRSTIDEDAFKEHGFDPAATTPMIGFDAGNGSAMPPPYIESENAAPVRAPVQAAAPSTLRSSQNEAVEKPVPIRPVSKPLDPAVKPPSSSSGWGIKLVGIAAVFCLLVAGVGAVGWYAVTAKLINIPGFEQAGKQTAAQEAKPGSADGQTEAASDPAGKEAKEDPGPAAGVEDQTAESHPNEGAGDAAGEGANAGTNSGERKANQPSRSAANPQKPDGKQAKPTKTKTKQGSRDDILQ
jgi:serine/threonine protein kinase